MAVESQTQCITKSLKGERMVPAYYWMRPTAFNDALSDGFISPASMKVRPFVWIEICKDFLLREIYVDAAWKGQSDMNAIRAIEELVKERVVDISHRVPWRAAQRSSDSTCPDMLAGDMDVVFLSLWNWVPHGRIRPHGFIFDAEVLADRGGALRRRDLEKDYMDALKRVVSGTWESIDEAKEGIARALEQVRENGEVRGTDAIREMAALEAAGARNQAQEQGGSIKFVWPGPLPLDYVIEAVGTPKV